MRVFIWNDYDFIGKLYDNLVKKKIKVIYLILIFVFVVREIKMVGGNLIMMEWYINDFIKILVIY